MTNRLSHLSSLLASFDSRSPAADALLSYRDPPRSERSERLVAIEQALGCPAGADVLARAEAIMRVVTLADEYSYTAASPLALFQACDALRALSTTGGDQP